MKVNDYMLRIPSASSQRSKFNERSQTEKSQKNRVPTTIISTPISTCVLINCEVSEEYTRCQESMAPCSKGRNLLNSGDKNSQKNFSRPLTAQNKERKRPLFPNFHTPKASINEVFFRKDLGKFDDKLSKSLVASRVGGDSLEKMKELGFYLKHEEIINNLKFFKTMKKDCNLNFYTIYEGAEKTGKSNEQDFRIEDVQNLLYLTLKKLENDYLPSLFKNEIVSEETVQKFFHELNDFTAIMIKKIALKDRIIAAALEMFSKFFLLFLEKIIENNRKKINQEIKNEMEKYKLENQALLKKIKELEEKIKINDDQFQIQKKELMLVQTNLKKENFDYNSQIVDLQNKIEEMLNPDLIEDNSYTMKAKCDALMRFVTKIETYNEEQTLIFSKGMKELMKEGFYKSNYKVGRKSTITSEADAEDSVKRHYHIQELIHDEFRNLHIFEHPFLFYLIKNFGNLRTAGFLDKPNPMEIGLMIDGFLAKFDVDQGIPSQNIPSLFVDHLLSNFENSFNTSIKITMICDYLKSKSDLKTDFFAFVSKIFGLFKHDVISNDNLLWILTFRSNLHKNLKKDQMMYADPENPVYFQTSEFEEVMDQTYSENEKLKNSIQSSFHGYKKESEVAKKESRKKQFAYIKSSQDFPLITTLSERLKMKDVGEVIEALNKLLSKMDKKNIGILKYNDICSYFENEFSINPLQRVFEKYFKSHVNLEKDEFYYKEFIEKLIETHIENKDNENKISYYEMMNFLCDAHLSAEKGLKEDLKKKVVDSYKNDKLFHYSFFKSLLEECYDPTLMEFAPLLYKFTLSENYFQKMFDKYKRNIHSGIIDSQINVRTWDLEFPHFYDKDKSLKNFMSAAENLKSMYGFLNAEVKKNKIKDSVIWTGRKASQIFGRKSTLTIKKLPDRKKSSAKLTMKNSYERDSPTYISEDTSEYDSPTLSPQKSRMSIYNKKKISVEKKE